MPALATDYFTKVGSPGSATTLSAPGHTIGATSWTVGATTNWPTDTGVIFAVDTVTLVNGVEVRNVGSYTEWEGVVASATSVTGTVLRYGTDRDYAANSLTRVYIPVASSERNRSVDGILIQHTQTGAHAAITATSLAATGNIISSAGRISTTLVGQLEDFAIPLTTYRTETSFDHVASGLVWSGDAYASTRNASMTAGVVYMNGRRIALALVAARSFTASRDVYVDVLDNANGTGTLVFTDATTNAASPALAANSMRIAIIVVGATNILSVASVNQGQEDRVLPIATSIAYSVTDSLGNLICPRDPTRKLLGFRRATTSQTTTSSSQVQITGLSCPVIVPLGRKVKVSLHAFYFNNTANDGYIVALWEGVVGGTQITGGGMERNSNTSSTGQDPFAINTPSSTSVTYNASFRRVAAGTVDTNATATQPTYITVELY